MKYLIIIIFLLTINCSNNKVVKNHGFSALDTKIKKISLNKTNKNDILQILGNPSSVSLFEENTWYFIEREKINRSVLSLGKEKLNKNNILEITFDEVGIVKVFKLYNIDDMNEIKISKDKTENMAIKKVGINNLLQSLYQKINSPKNRKRVD